ncbi:MAG TPA: hypothetical protein VGG33_10350, partial [Polyangia bacterium]
MATRVRVWAETNQPARRGFDPSPSNHGGIGNQTDSRNWQCRTLRIRAHPDETLSVRLRSPSLISLPLIAAGMLLAGCGL